MKQPEDTLTMDMFPTPTTKAHYRFYVKSHDGLTTEWCGLTRKYALETLARRTAYAKIAKEIMRQRGME